MALIRIGSGRCGAPGSVGSMTIRIPLPARQSAAGIEMVSIGILAEALAALVAPAGQPSRAGELARDWSTLSPLRARVVLLRLIQRIELGADRIEIRLFPDQLC